MSDEVEVGPASELTPGTVRGAGRYAVGNTDGQLFAVTRRCRHLNADLANGSIDDADQGRRVSIVSARLAERVWSLSRIL